MEEMARQEAEEMARQEAEKAERERMDAAAQETLWASNRRAAAPPASWRRAADWVDREFPTPDSGVFWPQPAVHEHRSRPFLAPEGGETDAKQVRENQERLTQLWRYSNSHGISWDELDEAYVAFSTEGNNQYNKWSRKQTSYEEPPRAEVEKQEARRRAIKQLEPYCGKLTPEKAYPNRVTRLASKLYAKEKKRFLGPWRPGRLTQSLQQLVAARMLRRETNERTYGRQKT